MKNGFTTVDINGANISWDLKNGIPLKDNSVDLIYSSHLLEHIPFKELILFLKDCKRVLKKMESFQFVYLMLEIILMLISKGGHLK